MDLSIQLALNSCVKLDAIQVLPLVASSRTLRHINTLVAQMKYKNYVWQLELRREVM